MENTGAFRQEYFARWSDMDFNQHMRNAAFLGYAEDTRLRYLEANGWTMAEFLRLKIGPVVLEDHLIYRREIGLLVPFSVDITLAGATESGSRMKLLNRFFLEESEGGRPAASVESHVIWLDLAARKPVTPPYGLKKIFLALPKAEGFEVLADR